MKFGLGRFPFMEEVEKGNLEIKAWIQRLFFLVSLLCGAVSNWSLVFCYSLGDALDSNSMHSIQKTTTRRIVDGKVVSEVNDTKILRR